MKGISRQAFYNVTSAVAVAILLHPLDVVKTLRMKEGSRKSDTRKAIDTRAAQRVGINRERSAIKSAWHLAQVDGLSRVYTGVGLTVLSAGVNWGVFRSVYEALKSSSVLARVRVGRTAVASTIASMMTIVLSYPLYSLKTEMVVRAGPDSSKQRVWQWLNAMKHGDSQQFRERYRGLASMLCTLPTGVLQMVIYEQLKAAMPASENHEHWRNVLKRMCWSAGSKVSATWLTYPFHVIRFHQQFPELLLLQESGDKESRLGTFRTAKLLIQAQGSVSLYRGFWQQTQKSLIQNVLTLLIFESLVAENQQQFDTRRSTLLGTEKKQA